MAKRALVIDDEADTREIVAAFLEPVGYQIRTAEGGEPGLLLAAAESPDLVIVDLSMPEMNGYDVCRALRHNPRTRHIPVIVLTASADPALVRKAYAAGAQACVTKPFRREALIAAIRAVVAGVPRVNL